MNKKKYIAPAIETIQLYTEAPLATSLATDGSMFVDTWSLKYEDEEENNSLTNEEIWGKEW